MIIKLKGYSPDREMRVLSKILKENGFEPVQGIFTDKTFVTEEDIPVETVDLIAATFAPKSDAQIMGSVREVRDRLLAETDWTQIPDVPLTAVETERWRTYRQALRDIPQTISDPCNIIWPAIPNP